MVEQYRHKPPTVLNRPRDMVISCAPLRSGVNLSSIVRTAGCCGISKVITCGNTKVDLTIARNSTNHVEVEVRRSLTPVLKTLSRDGYTLVALEQTTNSQNIHEFKFPRKTALVIGNERAGIGDEELQLVDVCVEIPVWGMPHSYNVATATAMALYEYCRQYPAG